MKYTVALSQADIQSIINGREVNVVLPNGQKLVIRQSYVLDATAPLLNDEYNVQSKTAERNRDIVRDMLKDSYQGGARMKKEETESMKLLTEIANLISTRYGVTAEESAQQIQTMIKTNSISFETLDELNR
ncbi:hypothetical protein N7O58_01060 [Enterococcus dispar]|uniref:hypothetical protein n=1 Tax=Enterococcus dispar TaxID=44009 RepID=UPI0021D4569A|nr:hypothetical protein [Enterococcus dispar]MCU7356266.1 hypothetical protein [Enterococcus dispar]